ncbi:MAG: DUF308 domain-containing protein [Bacilli bacterium]|nr:DUF308 domain-containing protein [Bacilli bacterium]
MIKKVYRISIVSSILLLLFGLLLVFNAEGFIKSISAIIGVILLLIGIFPVVDYFRYRKEGVLAGIGLISGIFSIVCGLMFLLNENMLMILVPVFIGVWMIINGINRFQIAFEIKDNNVNSWVITFIFSILIIIGGAYFIINPISGATFVTQTLGIIICIYAVLDIIDCILIRVKFKRVTEEIKQIDKVIDEQ